ncbi:glutamyl-tRNA synthetase [Nadsonia fulvescens var. elongata DSM 6958]|uniref:glutamate--tRNA ligase n=1 Tax=Nadsonia fulvescens var. elongata DSM 6958 TaxID=857566 RepID=A0A1E3PDH5_9ASCO|nr:glutamyl-tRNA synthetase [Nadsonia fulvescens var. elongata DSM 6958]
MSYTLSLAAKAPVVGYADLIAATIINGADSTITISYVDAPLVDKDNKESTAVLKADGEAIVGVEAVLKVLGEKFPVIYGKDAAKLSDEWISWAFQNLTVRDFKTLTPSLEKLESHLNFRSFIVGYAPTIADIAVWGVLRANAVVATSVKSGLFINIARWYKFFEADAKFGGAVINMTAILNEQRKASKTGQKKESHKANYDIPLPGAVEGGVVTRFPPEPSGYLHIGHAKAAVLNQFFAEEYKGKLIIRFDDTNPSKEKTEYQDSIIEDLKLLGVHGDRLTYSSDYFDLMYNYAIQMIKEGKAYCDDTLVDRMREERMDGIESARRNRSVEENLEVFEQMKQGTEEGLKNCLRAKISIDAPNKALRDPVIYRCNLTPHHRTGSTWKMYPTYDFCVPIVDSVEGVTHALRTTEYRDRNDQYKWMIKALGIRPVHIWDFARVNFVRTLLSKRKLQWFVDNGKVSNWDDPRFPTVRGVRRRGMTVEGLRNFIISQGPSKNVINLDWSLIWATNKKVIDPIAPRHTAVIKDNAVKVTISGAPETPVSEEKPKHKKNPAVGNKKVIFYKSIIIDQDDAATLKEGEELTFMDWGNAIVEKITKNEAGIVTGIDAKLHLEGDFRKTEHKITWLADTEDLVPVDLVDFDHLISKDKIEEGESFEDFLTPQTEFHTAALADVNIRNMKENEIIQFERKGYYRLDKPYSEGSPAVFFTIPDGKVTQKYGAKPSASK